MVAKNLILGGGLAGLTSAYFSRRRRIKQIIFESNSSLGGRIKTSLVGAVPVEWGAQFISKEDQNVMQLMEELRLGKQLQRFDLSDFLVSYENHALLESRTVLELSKVETGEIAELERFLGGVSRQKFAKLYGELSQETFSKWYCEQFGGEMKWLMDSMCKGITFSSSDEMSAIYGIAVISSFFSEAYGLERGMIQLIDSLEGAISKNAEIRLNSEVKRINFDGNAAKEIEISGGKPFQVSAGKTLPVSKNDKIVSALPAPILAKLVSDEKPLSKALKKIKYGGCSAVVFQTSGKFFGKRLGALFYDEPVTIAYDCARKFGNDISENGVIIALMPFRGKMRDAEKTALNCISQAIPDFEESIENSWSENWELGLPICSPNLFQIQDEIRELAPENLKITGDFMGMPSLDACVESAKSGFI